MSEYITVAEASQVPADRGLSVRIGDRAFGLFNIAGEIYALDGQCPHRGGPLGEGMTEHGHVYCPLHGWEFDVKTGACLGNPEKRARCFPTRVVDGKVQICV
jgi:3-phenylpropionate/trans-cinnamate dioxygenase ferredoxin component